MVPIVGRLYRHGVHIMIYGQSLVNKSPIDIMHAHRFVRQIEGNELSELETYPLLERLALTSSGMCHAKLRIGRLISCKYKYLSGNMGILVPGT